MQRDQEQILRGVLRELSCIGADGLATREARSTVATARSLLAWLIVRDFDLPAFSRQQRRRLQSQFGALAPASEPDRSISRAPLAGQLGRAATPDPVERASMLVSELIRNPAEHPHGDATKARDLVRSLIAPQEFAQSRVDQTAQQVDVGRDARARLTVNQVNDYFRSLQLDAGKRQVESVQYIPGGFSRETILLSMRGSGEADDIVLRKVVDGRARGCLFEEWAVLSFAWELGLPTPKPLWLEADPGKLGNVFFAVSRVQGVNCGDVFGKEGSVDAAVALQLARRLATLHQADASRLAALPVLPMCTADEIRRAIDQTAKPAALVSRSDEPMYDVLRDWLRANITPSPPRCALLHGDVGFHNLLVDGGRITGILDWERAHLGDPAEELAYVRPTVESVVPWRTFLDEYCRAGGQAPSSQALRFYTVWQGVWRASVCLDMHRDFLAEAAPPLHEALPAFIYGPRFIAAAARAAFDLPAAG